MENKLSERIKNFSFHIMYFQSHFGSFWLRVWRILYFCDNNGPHSNVMFSTLYFKHSLLNCRLKSKEMTACLQNCRFYRSIFSKYSSEVKWKLKIYQKLSKSKDFSNHDLRWENVIFWGCADLRRELNGMWIYMNSVWSIFNPCSVWLYLHPLIQKHPLFYSNTSSNSYEKIIIQK